MNSWSLRRAIHTLREGGIIAYPTEAVYGLGCDPWDEDAVVRLLDIKQRPWQKGLILIASDFNQLTDFIEPLSPDILKQLDATWPGPVTWLLPAKATTPRYLTGEHDTIAVRVTAHKQTAKLCQAAGHAIVSTSANITGFEPTVNGMAADGRPYTGFLYAGLMIDADGAPRVVEYNCRFGDPETQPILMRLQSDLIPLCEAALDGCLDTVDVQWDDRAAVGVVLAAGGYPETYRKGDIISGLDVADGDDCKVFHAGTSQRDNDVVTAGGRVLCATALGATVAEAQAKAYEMIDKISWQDMYYRTDIAYRAIARQ